MSDLPWWAIAILVIVAIWIVAAVVLVALGRVVLARELATIPPNLIRLIVLAIASLYLASPIDLIPDFVPLAGGLDDAVVAGFALRFVLSTTDPALVRSHWRGDPATLERLTRWLRVGGGIPPAVP